MKSLLYNSIALMLLFSSCLGNPEEDVTTGEIVGSVSDKTTGEPIATANVVLLPGGNSTVTGTDGSFYYKDMEAGKYTIEISKESYISAKKDIDVTIGKTSVTHLLLERVPDKVTADRDILDFGSNSGLNTLSFGIVNRSYEDLEWVVVENSDWIVKVEPQEGVLPYGKTGTIVVVIDREKLEEGENIANLVVMSSNGYSEVKILAKGDKKPTKARLELYDASDIRGYSATLNASIIDPGYPTYTERGFVYSTSQDPTLENNIGKVASPKNETLEYSAKIENLTLNTKYYVRAYAINEEGVAYSSVNKEFTTIPVLPEVSTGEVYEANISEGTATFRGTIISEGEPAYSECGFVYSTMPNPTINDNKVIKEVTGTGAYSAYVTGLPKTGYYVRAYVKNEAGVVYGNSVNVSAEYVIIPGSKLMVQTKDLGIYRWSDANTICNSCVVGGYTGWRLPTRAELSLIAANMDYVGGITDGKYWSSYYYNGDYYYYNFATNSFYYDYSSRLLYVRAVRTITE